MSKTFRAVRIEDLGDVARLLEEQAAGPLRAGAAESRAAFLRANYFGLPGVAIDVSIDAALEMIVGASIARDAGATPTMVANAAACRDAGATVELVAVAAPADATFYSLVTRVARWARSIGRSRILITAAPLVAREAARWSAPGLGNECEADQLAAVAGSMAGD